MFRNNVRCGAAFLGAFLLTLSSGMASAMDDGQPIKSINGPGSDNVITLGTVQVTANVPSVVTMPPVIVTAAVDNTAVPQTIAGIQITNLAGVTVHATATKSTTPAATPKNNPDPCDNDGDPILAGTGTKVETVPVFALPGEMGLKYELYYNTAAVNTQVSDPGYLYWTSNLSYWLDTDCSTSASDTGRCHQTIAHRPDGSILTFSGGPAGSVYQETSANGVSVTNPVALLTRDASTGDYTLHDEDALTEVYSSSGQLLSITDPSGIGWTLTYTTGANASIRITHTNGQSFTIAYTSTGSTITDPAGDVYTLTGISGGGGFTLSSPGSPATTVAFKNSTFANTTPPAYGFTAFTETDYNGTPYAYTSYVTAPTNAAGGANPYYKWANGTRLADGSENVSIAYSPDTAGNLSATITNPLGHVSVKNYDGTNGSGGAYNGQLSSVSSDAVADCGATEATRAYDSNGNLSKTVDNNGNVHTYTYGANGQLQTETEAYGTAQARTTDYAWDPDTQLNRPLTVTVEGWSKTTYTYNAQNRLASVAVSNLSDNGHANETLTTTYSYTLFPDGMVHTMSVAAPSPGGSDTEVYTYDTLGNLISLADGLGHTTTYGNYNGLGEAQTITGPNGDVTNYTYDPRGRVATKTTHPNGTAATWTYGYDGFGLLASVNAPDGEVTTWHRDAEMRVTSMTHNDKDGTSTETYGYDANNDVVSEAITRNGTETYSASTTYNALGRPYQIHGNHGQQLIYSYDGNGNVLAVTDATGHVTSYLYDALNRVMQKTESGGASPAIPADAPNLSAPGNSTNGSYTVSWTSVETATSYNLQEQENGGSWTTVQSDASASWSASGHGDATYGYRAQACNSSGCGPWSGVSSTTVLLPPGTSSLSVPSSSDTGSYTVNWSSVATATTYNLQEQVNGGDWTIVQSDASASWSASGHGDATYGYRVQACSSSGCGPWSSVASVTVLLPPASAPALSVPGANGNGSYTVSWSGVSTASSYTLQEQVNGGSWATLQANASTSWSASGKGSATYGYRVQACNASGCGPWSGTGSITVSLPVPIAINGHSYSTSSSPGSTGGASAAIGFEIVGGNTWEIFTSNQHVTNTLVTSGAVPSGAATVQYTWTEVGLANGADSGGGTVTNGASTPAALDSNPSSNYTVAMGKNSSNVAGLTYQVTVTFYNAAGANISRSTCTMTATVAGTL